MPNGEPPQGCPSALADIALTLRQRQILQLAAAGLSSREIGERLHLSPRTVDDHVAAACRRFGVRTRVQAVALALTRGLLTP